MNLAELFSEVESIAGNEFDLTVEIRKDSKGRIKVKYEVYDRWRNILSDASAPDIMLEAYRDDVLKYHIENKNRTGDDKESQRLIDSTDVESLADDITIKRIT